MGGGTHQGQSSHLCGKPFGVPLGRSLTLAKDKELGFRQDFGLGRGSGLKYFSHYDKSFLTTVMEVISGIAALFVP